MAEPVSPPTNTPNHAAIAAALTRAGIAQPTLVIDRAALAANIAEARRALAPTALALRIVTKSLQAPGLLQAVMDSCATDRLMVFNGVMLEAILAAHPASDVLTGRPLPAAQVEAFVRRRKADPAPAAHPQWLVDSPDRLAQYAAIARGHGAPMRLNLEIDVGLRRGGLIGPAAVAELIDLAAAEPLLTITGLMGYDAQVPAMPSPGDEMAKVRRRYAAARTVLLDKLGADPTGLTLNTAGSPTYSLHLDDEVANEVSIGSAFVKPLNFDLPTLAAHVPACFVAMPVLKVLDGETSDQRRVFLYGGCGDAEPVWPAAVAFSPVGGGRYMLTAPADLGLRQDDFVLLRPRESEGAFLQFGDIAVFDAGEIVDWWPTFPVAA